MDDKNQFLITFKPKLAYNHLMFTIFIVFGPKNEEWNEMSSEWKCLLFTSKRQQNMFNILSIIFHCKLKPINSMFH